jgi:hypothetical protein
MKFTITNDTTYEIKRVVTLSNRIADAAIEDGTIKTVKSDFLVEHLEQDETSHEGNYPVRYYAFDGNDFTVKDVPDYMPPELRSPEEILMMLVEQMLEAGLVLPLHRDLIRTKKHANDLIDQAAGRVRSRHISQGIAIEEEYNQAKRQSQWFIDNPTGTAPSMVVTWATASNRTNAAAAQHILDTAATWELVLNTVYDIRLTGKAAVDAEPTNYIATAQTYIDQLDAL